MGQIVVADDDAMQRSFTSAVLRKMGYDPIEVADGDSALDAIITTNARIIICDINMPGLDGLTLTHRIRSADLAHYVHIFMVTGSDQIGDRRSALKAGVDDFMTKPFDASLMKVRIRAAARLIAHESALAEQYRKLQAAKGRIEADLKAAADAQRRLLPMADGSAHDCRFHSAFVPSAIVSGDMFSYFELDAKKVGFYAVDVSGHGVHAALLSVAIGHMITAEYFLAHGFNADGLPDPAALVSGLNERFVRDGCDEYFTMFCGVLDQKSDNLTFCQAGY
ncbi:MAG: response regulator, partial [Candidatus Saccharibacteria bacterium]|nr:response regulator [Pseudorhodobacter sp.]